MARWDNIKVDKRFCDLFKVKFSRFVARKLEVSFQTMSPVVQYTPSDGHSTSTDRRGCTQRPTTSKAINTLRLLLQASINEEIDAVMQKYISLYIEPAIENIEANQKLGVVPTTGMPPRQYVKSICRQILDEAKRMY